MTPAALQSKSSTLGPRARGDELGLTAVAFSLFICFHLHLGFAFRPSHLLAQAVHEVARARRALHFDPANIFSLKQSTRSRAHAGQYGFNAYSLYLRADDVQSPAAMPEPMDAALFGRS